MQRIAILSAIVLATASAWAQKDAFSQEDSTPAADAEADPLLDGGQETTTKTTPLTESGETTLALNPTAAIGLGVGFTIPGTPAIMVHKYFNNNLGLQAGLTFDMASFSAGPAGMEVDGSVLSAGVAAYGVYRLRAASNFTVNALAGLELGFSSVSFGSGAQSVSESGTDFGISTGLQAELFVLKQVSLYAQFGVSLAFLGDVSTARQLGTAPDPTSNTSSTVLRIGPDSMVQSFGLVWWL